MYSRIDIRQTAEYETYMTCKCDYMDLTDTGIEFMKEPVKESDCD